MGWIGPASLSGRIGVTDFGAGNFVTGPIAGPLRVGIVGTGYAAKARAEVLRGDDRVHLIAVAGHTSDQTQAFAQTYALTVCDTWQALVNRPDLDLILVATANHLHGPIVHAALTAGKHVVVEFPLSLDLAEAEALVTLARSQQRLLHIEHIELLGGLHRASRQFLPQVGAVFAVDYATLTPQRPVSRRWTYHRDWFGFPLMGALSRLHRLTDLFGPVATVSCQLRYWDHPATIPADAYYTTCLCQAQLQFESGILATVTYGKGEALWQSARSLTIQGEQGALVFAGDAGQWVTAAATQAITLGSRRGLFAQDMQQVLAYLQDGTPLYVTPAASLYALKVADAARRSAHSQQVIAIA